MTVSVEKYQWMKFYPSDWLLEPRDNRGDFSKGLMAVYPMYQRKFRDLSPFATPAAQETLDGMAEEQGQKLGGSSPTFLFVWCCEKDFTWKEKSPRIDFSIAQRLAARKAVAA